MANIIISLLGKNSEYATGLYKYRIRLFQNLNIFLYLHTYIKLDYVFIQECSLKNDSKK